MKDVRVMFKNGADIVINGVDDDEVRIVRIQKKKSKIKTIWIRAKNETISIDKKEIALISYMDTQDDKVKNTNVNSGLYQ